METKEGVVSLNSLEGFSAVDIRHDHSRNSDPTLSVTKRGFAFNASLAAEVAGFNGVTFAVNTAKRQLALILNEAHRGLPILSYKAVAYKTVSMTETDFDKLSPFVFVKGDKYGAKYITNGDSPYILISEVRVS